MCAYRCTRGITLASQSQPSGGSETDELSEPGSRPPDLTESIPQRLGSTGTESHRDELWIDNLACR